MEDRNKKLTASEQVYEQLRDAISSGVWKPGERLPSEGELAERCGVNRLTLRLALQKLNAIGVVETRTGSGTYVVEFDFENYLSLASKFFNMGGMTPFVTEFRNHMEIECARLACERAAPGEMDELERLAQEHRQAWLSSGELEHDEWCRRVADTDMAFHEQVIRMAHNPLYVYAFDVAREPIYAYILLSVRKWEPELVQNFRMYMHRDIHYRICESIRKRDFAACQSDYAAMISSYTRVNWSAPETFA